MKVDYDAQRTKRNCTDPTLILGRTYLIPYLNRATKNKDRDANTSVDTGGLAVPLGTNTAAGKQYKAQEARSASLGTGSSPIICFRAKTSKNSQQGPSGPPVK